MNLQICKYDLTYLKICKYGSIICKHDIICKIRNLCRICRIKTIFSPFATPPHTTVSGYWGLRGTRTWDRKGHFFISFCIFNAEYIWNKEHNTILTLSSFQTLWWDSLEKTQEFPSLGELCHLSFWFLSKPFSRLTGPYLVDLAHSLYETVIVDAAHKIRQKIWPVFCG